MNIDLFISERGEAGLLADRKYKPLPVGAIFDAQTMEITLEFEAQDPLHLNIPVEEQYMDALLMGHRIYYAMMQDDFLVESLELPLLYLNDPYGGAFGYGHGPGKARRALVHFEQFMKRCDFAQGIHRGDLGDEGSAGSVLQGKNPKSLEFTKELVRERAMEMAPSLGLNMSGPRMAGPGGMGAGGGGRRIMPTRREDDE